MSYVKPKDVEATLRQAVAAFDTPGAQISFQDVQMVLGLKTLDELRLLNERLEHLEMIAMQSAACLGGLLDADREDTQAMANAAQETVENYHAAKRKEREERYGLDE